MSANSENVTIVFDDRVNASFNLTDEQRTGFFISGVYLTVVGVLAVFGNVIVLVIIIRDPRLRSKPHNLLLVNLACADLSCLIGGYPLTTISGYMHRWVFGAVPCKISAFFTFLMSLTSMDTLVAICVYRYIMICQPGKAFLLTRRVTFYVILFCWLYGLFWTTLPLLGWGAYGVEPFSISCSLKWGEHGFHNITYLSATIIFCYVLHICIMIKCYRSISMTVKELAIRDQQRSRGVIYLDDMLHRNTVADDQQVTRMCFFVVIVFVGVWTPYAVICCIHIILPEMPLAAIALPTMAAKSGCMLNPLVYFATNRSFRLKTFEMLCCQRQGNAVGVDLPPSSKERYDDVTKEGIYLGQQSVDVEHQVTMF